MYYTTTPIIGAALSAFAISAVSSFIAGLTILALSHLDDIRYMITSGRRYQHLEGKWYQYHLTTDSKSSPATFWSMHEDHLKVTCFGRVRGQSQACRGSRLRYRIAGSIRKNVMQLCLTNSDAVELPVNITYGLLSGDQLVGVWVGHDYDERMSAGPIIMSRALCTTSQLDALVQGERLLSTTHHAGRVRGSQSRRGALRFGGRSAAKG